MLKYLWAIRALRRPVAHRPLSIFPRHEQINVQHVRLRRPFFTKKRMAKVLISVIGIAVCFYYTLEIVEVETTEDKKGEEEGSDDAIFIPLGFYHECPPTYYKSSDPEWKAFGEFANDRAKRQRVTRKIIELLEINMNRKPAFYEILGVPIKRSRDWLEVHYPKGPPPQFEQNGIEITSNAVAWTTRSISAQQYSRIQSGFRPIPVLSALWFSQRMFWALQLARIREMLRPRSHNRDLDTKSSISSTNPPSLVNGSQHVALPPTTGGEDHSLESEQVPFENLTADEHPDARQQLENYVKSQGLPPFGQDVDIVWQAFKWSLAQNTGRPTPKPERGTLVIHGLVKFAGPKGTCTMDVLAYHNPRDSTVEFLGGNVRAMQRPKKHPKGEE